MSASLKTWVPLAMLLCACGSSQTASSDRVAGEPGGGTGTTGVGSGTGATSSSTTGGGDVTTTGGPSSTTGTTTGVGTTGSATSSTTTGGGFPPGAGTTTGGTGPTTSGTTTTGTTSTTGSGPTGSGGAGTSSGAGGSGGSGGPGGSGGSGGSGSSVDAGLDAHPPEPPPSYLQAGQSGLLTAGATDDNVNFDRFTAYKTFLQSENLPGIVPISDADFKASHDAALQRGGARATVDISFVIDTTGSMGDELGYLQSEFLAISSEVATKYPNAQPRWSLVLYRDVGDEYVVRPFDFTTDTNTFQVNLAMQAAMGGGDIPESPEKGLAEMAKLAWRSDAATAKIAFWVADAPHHTQNAQAMATALSQIKSENIHVYPVASSGVDEFTELTMRSAAAYTLGRYLFLTDDSGVGNSHKEPSIPCYFVTRLDRAILRVVDIELTGNYHEPAASEVVRTAGNPQQGACTVAGAQVFAF